MASDKIASIKEKIQKLLSLANSDNENEAKLAASKAQELLVKFNLTQTEVEAHSEDYVRSDLDNNVKRQSKETNFIHLILTKYFFVDIVYKREARSFLGQRRNVVVVLLGKEHNVEIAKFVNSFLHDAFRNLWYSYRKQTDAPLSSRESFYFGVYKGLCEQLEASKAKVENEMGLVVVRDQGLEDFKSLQFPKTQSSKMKINQNDSEAFGNGKEQGKSLRIAKGLGGESKQTGLFIGGKK